MQKFGRMTITVIGDEIEKTLCHIVLRELLDEGYVIMDWAGQRGEIKLGPELIEGRDPTFDRLSTWRDNIQEALKVVEQVATESRKALDTFAANIPKATDF